jgi:hypothetical protein
MQDFSIGDDLQALDNAKELSKKMTSLQDELG